MLVVVSAIEKDSIDSTKCVCLSDVAVITEDSGIIILAFSTSIALMTALDTVYDADITPKSVTYYNVQFKKENIIAVLV
jgi:hypothetical protein